MNYKINCEYFLKCIAHIEKHITFDSSNRNTMPYIASLPNPTHEAARELYMYPILADYEDEITDIDDKNKKVRIKYKATMAQEMVIHSLIVHLIDEFVMDDQDVIESIVEGLYLYDPRTILECNPVVKL